MRITEIKEKDRPRERMLSKGSRALSDAEVLSIILQKGTKGENVVEVSNRILSKYNLQKLSGLSIRELQKIKGIGIAKATQIKALFEFSRRIKVEKSGRKIKSAGDVFNYLHPLLSSLDKETFCILHLNSQNEIIKDEIVSIGTLDSSLIHPRSVFRSAIKENCSAIIIAHNHPSGNPEPSEEDTEITKQLFGAAKLLGIQILDHVIIGRKDYYSFTS